MTRAATAVALHYRQLYESCGAALTESLGETRAGAVAESHAFVADLGIWIAAIEPRLEAALLRSAAREYQHALLSLVLGQYRESFRGLRLFLEMSVASVFYSANELMLREWLAGRRDNSWRRFIDSQRGVFTTRYCDAFCRDLRDQAMQYNGVAARVYRECSEFVHGNPVTETSIPERLLYDDALFNSWHERARTARLVVSFALFMRYFDTLASNAKSNLESTITDQLGHIESVRGRFVAKEGQ